MQTLSIIAIGAGIGWIAGLSEVSAAAVILTSLLAIASALVIALQSLRASTKSFPSAKEIASAFVFAVQDLRTSSNPAPSTAAVTNPTPATSTNSSPPTAGGSNPAPIPANNSTSTVGVTNPTPTFIDARPAALLIVAISLAAPLGILARTNHLFACKSSFTTCESQSSRDGYGGLSFAESGDCGSYKTMVTNGNYKRLKTEIMARKNLDTNLIPFLKKYDNNQIRAIVEVSCP